jgi:hypothetical protein
MYGNGLGLWLSLLVWMSEILGRSSGVNYCSILSRRAMLDCSTFRNDARQSDFLHMAEIGTDKSKAGEKRAFTPYRQYVYYDSNYLKLQGYIAGSGHEIQPGAQSVH